MASTTQDAGLLENGGYWEETTPESTMSATGRTKRWLLDVTRSLFKFRGRRKQLRRTAYLDGLRGFAALLVYWHHHQLWAHEQGSNTTIMEDAWGYEGNYRFATMHGFRTFFTGGHYSVTVFFVISGYLLSTKPLSLIQAGELGKLGDNLASALFRHWLRLYIPVIATTFLYMTSWHVFGYWTFAEHKSSFGEELWNWYVELKNFSFVFSTSGDPWFTYNFHAWSIPAELRGQSSSSPPS